MCRDIYQVKCNVDCLAIKSLGKALSQVTIRTDTFWEVSKVGVFCFGSKYHGILSYKNRMKSKKEERRGNKEK